MGIGLIFFEEPSNIQIENVIGFLFSKVTFFKENRANLNYRMLGLKLWNFFILYNHPENETLNWLKQGLIQDLALCNHSGIKTFNSFPKLYS